MPSVETQFHVPPFPPFPSAERYVRVGSQDDALQRVRRAVEAWEAISLVIGPPGTGKSLICQMLQKHFSREREVIVFGDATLENPQALQRHLLNRLDRIRGIAPTPPMIGDDPQLAIIERIAGSSKEFSGLLLLVDEAQTLRPEVLETIRILTNVMTGGRPRVSAVLLGGPRLDETLALPSLDALVQRVATRCYLHPLSSDETVQYVREVARKCGDSIKIDIEETAVRSIHRACSGVPRLVNQLMSAAISFAGSRNQKIITAQTVDQAWAVLQQLPSPLLDEPALIRPVSDVEFGPLSDDIDQEPSHDFTVETEIAFACNEPSNYGAISYDCAPTGTFAYDDCHIDDVEIGDVEIGDVEIDMSAAAEESRRSTPTPDELFGDFEEEESVCEPTSRRIAGRGEPLKQSVAAPGTADRGAAAVDDHDDTEPNDLEASLHREIISLRGVAGAPVLWMEDEDGENLVDDDRDLLVIEDDVDVDGATLVNEAPPAEPAGVAIAVDFQSMLAKMRSPKR